MLYNSSDIDT